MPIRWSWAAPPAASILYLTGQLIRPSARTASLNGGPAQRIAAWLHERPETANRLRTELPDAFWWTAIGAATDQALKNCPASMANSAIAGTTECTADSLHLAVTQAAGELAIEARPCGLARDVTEQLGELTIGKPEAKSDQRAISDQLRLRAGPLRDLFSTRGPGAWQSLRAKLATTDPPDELTITVLLPLYGGFGRSLPRPGTVTVEGLLANPWPELPETARVVYALAESLNNHASATGRVGQSEPLPGFRALAEAFWTTLLALDACEQVEWLALTPETLQLAARVWHSGRNLERSAATQLISWYRH